MLRASLLLPVLAVLVACARPALLSEAPSPPAPVAIVPGCPSEADGTLSECQWRRVVWAHHLWESRRVGGLIPSGNAVHNPYVEAEAMKAGLVALGVPEARIWPEPRALHTDENIAYGLRIVGALGLDAVAVASESFQANSGCWMVAAWTRGTACFSAPMDVDLVAARLARGVPEIRTAPASDWVPLEEREAAIAAQTGWKRPPSFWLYLGNTLKRPFGLVKPPVLPE